MLTREAIANAALQIAGAEGFPAVTMRRIAQRLGVTVRALYNHIDDRQEVIDLAAEMLLGEWQLPALDPDDWQDSFRGYAWSQRDLYRRYPRAILVGIDEQVRLKGVHPSRLTHPERVLGFLVDIGIPTATAALLHGGFLMQLTGFTLLVDHPSEHRQEQGGLGPVLAPAPKPWLDASPDLDLPILRLLADEGMPIGADATFARLVEIWIVTIEAHRG